MRSKSKKATDNIAELGPIADAIRSFHPYVHPLKKRRRVKKSFSSEVRLLREIAWWAIRYLRCYFCDEVFIPVKKATKLTFGHRHHKPFKLKLTLHHRDGDHDENKHDNLRWSHSTCHKRHHIKEVHEKVKTFDVLVYDEFDVLVYDERPKSKKKKAFIGKITIRARSMASARRKAIRKGLTVQKISLRKEKK